MPSGWLYATYHLLGEPETTIDLYPETGVYVYRCGIYLGNQSICDHYVFFFKTHQVNWRNEVDTWNILYIHQLTPLKKQLRCQGIVYSSKWPQRIRWLWDLDDPGLSRSRVVHIDSLETGLQAGIGWRGEYGQQKLKTFWSGFKVQMIG